MLFLLRYSRQGCRLLMLLGLWLCASAASAQSVSCQSSKQMNEGSNDTHVPTMRLAANAFSPGAVIWRSDRIFYQVRCSGTRPGTFYISVDPDNRLSGINPALDVELEFEQPMRTTRSVKSGGNINTGVIIPCTPFCDPGDPRYYHNRYSPVPVDFIYRVVLRARGGAPPADGKLAAGTYTLFRVSGEKDKGINDWNQMNFGGTLSGLNNITVFSCKPTISVTGNNGATVNFGSVASKSFVANQIGKQVPFSIDVNMSGAENGQACRNNTMRATFNTSQETVRNRTVIRPTPTSGFGIMLSQASAPTTPIALRTELNLGLANGTVMRNQFLAGIQWLGTQPQVGPFNASVTVEVTLR